MYKFQCQIWQFALNKTDPHVCVYFNIISTMRHERWSINLVLAERWPEIFRNSKESGGFRNYLFVFLSSTTTPRLQRWYDFNTQLSVRFHSNAVFSLINIRSVHHLLATVFCCVWIRTKFCSRKTEITNYSPLMLNFLITSRFLY